MDGDGYVQENKAVYRLFLASWTSKGMRFEPGLVLCLGVDQVLQFVTKDHSRVPILFGDLQWIKMGHYLTRL